MTSQQGKILFLQKQLANMFDVKIHLDLHDCIYFLRKFPSVQENFIKI